MIWLKATPPPSYKKFKMYEEKKWLFRNFHGKVKQVRELAFLPSNGNLLIVSCQRWMNQWKKRKKRKKGTKINWVLFSLKLRSRKKKIVCLLVHRFTCSFMFNCSRFPGFSKSHVFPVLYVCLSVFQPTLCNKMWVSFIIHVLHIRKLKIRNGFEHIWGI